MASKRINHHLKLIGVALLAYCTESYKLDESLVGIPSKKHISFHAKGMYNDTLTHISLYKCNITLHKILHENLHCRS